MTTQIDCTENFHRDVLDSALAPNTRKAYTKGWEDFSTWCGRKDTDPLAATADMVAHFLIEVATQPSSVTGKPLAMSSVGILQCAINRSFLDHGMPSPTHHPTVSAAMRGLKRLRGAPPRRVRALRADEIRQMIAQCGDSPIGIRDAAILSLGFAAALRRSEICALQVSDIEFLLLEKEIDQASHMIITIRKSKTDQNAQGQRIAIPDGSRIRPVSRLRHWLDVSGITDGYIFRTMRRGGTLRELGMHHSDIPRLVKKYAEVIGLDPTEYAGHSLRAGFVTSAAVHRARLDKIMEVTRHTNPQTVMKYIRDVDIFRDHAGQDFL